MLVILLDPSIKKMTQGRSLAWPASFLLGKSLVKCTTIIGGDRNAQMHYLTALNTESAEQMALLHLTRLFPRRKEAGHARLPKTGGGVRRVRLHP